MVFRLFTRKSTLDATASAEDDQNTRLPTPTPSLNSVTRHSPFRFPAVLRSALGGSSTDLTLKDSDQATDSIAEGGNSSAPLPPVTPSPPPAAEPNDTKILHNLMLTVPPKILHAYTLAHLHPETPFPPTIASSPALGSLFDNTLRPPSPDTVTKLTAFFSTLAPPPLLHCVRCHKDFHDIENEEKDKACRVAHDDESALVSRVSGASGGTYETLWGCCGQTASGDGSEGPPDGWCYEGRHTTDVKRARFRADSTMHNDKLTSCIKLNCHGIRDRLPHASLSRTVVTTSARKSNPSPARSQASTLITRSARKRPRKSLKESGSENEADSESLAGRAAKAKDKERVSGRAAERDEGTSMATDEPSKSKSKPKSQPIYRARPTPNTPITGSQMPAGSAKAKTTATKPKSTSHTLLSQSRTHVASDSEASTRSRPRTRSYIREESRGRTTSKLTRADISERVGRAKKAAKQLSRFTTSEEGEAETSEDQESNQEERGRDRKKRRLRS